MKFHNGPPPDNVELDETWRGISEPSPIMLQIYAVPFAIFLGGSFYFLWDKLVPMISINFSATMGNWEVVPILLSFPLLIFVHELIHAAVQPGWGLGPNSYIGVWVSKFLFYAHYNGPLTRNRFLLMLAMPFLVISVLPLAIALTGIVPPRLASIAAWFSVWNALFACGDALGFLLIFAQIPRNAVVQNRGWLSFWKPVE